ncbi:MAG TPA: hypothetical protein VFV66_02100 [Nonomuraea sp.]|nr:hypothetical protein [Nonomuraea sp.]
MIRRVCAAVVVVAAAAGGALQAVPAHADVWSDLWNGTWNHSVRSGNRSDNSGSIQSGNTFGDVTGANRGEGATTNVNNVNGIASTATHGGITVTYIFD